MTSNKLENLLHPVGWFSWIISEELHTRKTWHCSWSPHVSAWRNTVGCNSSLATYNVLTAILLRSKFFQNVIQCRPINTQQTFRKKHNIFFTLLGLRGRECADNTPFRNVGSHKTQASTDFFCNVYNTVLSFVSVTIVTVSLRPSCILNKRKLYLFNVLLAVPRDILYN
jgi:hypothetical protein